MNEVSILDTLITLSYAYAIWALIIIVLSYKSYSLVLIIGVGVVR